MSRRRRLFSRPGKPDGCGPCRGHHAQAQPV